jgi:type IV pilus assembly protein PilW
MKSCIKAQYGAYRTQPKESGLTLVELMVAMTIGLFLVLVIATLFVGAKQTYRVQDNLARVQENGRFAMEMLGRNIRDAGYTNISFSPPASLYAPPSATSFVKADGTPDVAITGSDGSAGSPDAITVSYDTASDCLNAAAPGGRAVNVFSINASNQLICLGNGSAASQVMLDDVEDMQILYGEDTDNDQTPNRYVPAGTAGLVMGNVYAVHVCVLVRSDEDNLADKKQTYIDCKGASVTATDRRIRRTFSATYNLRNRTQ